jgi:predicted Ser/Thr protein kinase
MLNKFKFLIAAVLVLTQVSQASQVSCHLAVQGVLQMKELEKSKNRPTTDEILRLDPKEKAQILKDSQLTDSEKKTFQVMFETVVEILENWDGRQVVLLGRDAELIYDTALYLFKKSNVPEALYEKIRLVNLSRPVIESSSYSQVRNYLIAQAGVDLKKVIEGEQKFLIFDTGNRGSIYLKILKLMTDQIKENDPQWKAKLIHLLTEVDFVLLATEAQPTVAKVIADIKGMTTFDRALIEEYFDKYNDHLYFRQIKLPKSEKAGVLPTELYPRFRWVVENIEYQPHWEGRTLTLTQNGSERSKTLEHDPRENKSGYIIRQVKLIEYLQTSPDAAKYISAIQSKLKEKQKSKPADKVQPQVEAPKPVIKTVPIKAGELPKIGALVDLKGRIVQIKKELGSGKRGVVFLVEDINNKELMALKIAKHDDAETLDSFKRESEKQMAYEKSKITYSRIFSEDTNWILKELVTGERADAWVKKWNLSKDPKGGAQMKALIDLLKQISSQSIYIGDLNPTNLMWSQNKWIIIDSGDATYNVDPKTARLRFVEKNKDRWKKYFDDQQKRSVFETELENGLL